MPPTKKKLGTLVDEIWLLDQQLSLLNSQVTELKKKRATLETEVINELPKNDAKGVIGRQAKAIVKVDEIPTVKDWDALYAHILKTEDFSLMQRRVGEKAIKERWADGEEIPGVDRFTRVHLSITKAG